MLDIKRSGRLNHIDVNGIPTSQHYNVANALDALYDYLKNQAIEIRNIIEVGTLHGGFTTLLANHKISDDAQVHTFDIEDHKPSEFVNSEKVICHIEDVFESEKLKELLSSKENYLLFCDGGDKIKEFNTFSAYLKPNDFIFCHDYVRTNELFLSSYRGVIWDWHQSNFPDIEKAVNTHGLINILPEVFESVVWSSYKK